MVKVLIADQRTAIVKLICSQLAGKCQIMTATNGKHVLDLCREFQPDLLVLDMELPHLDGLSVLRTIRTSGLNVQVLACTVCTDSVYAMRQMVNLGVQYFLPKPSTVAATVTRIHEMILDIQGHTWSMEDEANSLLLTLGMRMNLGGYACTREAILTMLGDENKQVTKVVYPEVALKCGGTAKRIERVIRCAIIDAWEHRDESVWRMYFKPNRNGEIPCPSNSYFISRMSMCINQRKIG